MNMNKPLAISLVQAPSKLTTFKWGPRWIIIFSSDASDSREVVFKEDLTILTATVLTLLSFGSCTVPICLAWTTTPNCPAPNCFPIFHKMIQHLLIAWLYVTKSSKSCKLFSTLHFEINHPMKTNQKWYYFVEIPIENHKATDWLVHPEEFQDRTVPDPHWVTAPAWALSTYLVSLINWNDWALHK